MSAEQIVSDKLEQWQDLRAVMAASKPDGCTCYCCGADSTDSAGIGPLKNIGGFFACPPCLALIERGE